MMQSELFLDVRYYETDQMGIVHHSNYIRYFECGRTDMLKKLGLPIEKIEEAGVMLPVVSVECRYKVPARLGDTLRIVSSIDKVPIKKFCDCIELEELSKIFIALTLGFRYATISPTIKVKWNASIGMEVRLKCYAVSLF